MTHIDEWLDSPKFNLTEGEKAARLFLEVYRMPAWKKSLLLPLLAEREIFCQYEGSFYRCTGASRLGDVWLTSKFQQEHGYEKRVDVAACSKWGTKP